MKTQALVAYGLLIMLVSQSGCDVDPETLESLQSAVRTVSAAQSSSQSSAETEADSVATAALAAQSANAQFVPKHPHRIDPFSFPVGAQVGDSESTSMTTVAEIEVLGFANVGKQHVLLRSGETSRSMQVGESISGIRVIAINPPTVQLQMGTLIWTATMFDKADTE
jgi:hypothetical protein